MIGHVIWNSTRYRRRRTAAAAAAAAADDDDDRDHPAVHRQRWYTHAGQLQQPPARTDVADNGIGQFSAPT